MNVPPRSRPRSLPGALILSIAAHVLLVVFAVPAAPSDTTPGDGVTAALAAGVSDLAAIEYPIEPTPVPAGPAAPAAHAPAEAQKPPEKPPVAEPKPVPPPPPKVDDPYADLDAKPSKTAAAEEPEPSDAPAEPPPKAAKTAKSPPKTAKSEPAAAGAAGDEASPPALGGALGDGASKQGGELAGQGGAGDLGRAFTRAIPIANQADASWAQVGLGNAGSLRARISIGEDGHVEGFEPLEPNPNKLLVALIRRTLAMLRGGTFAVSPGSVSAGANELRVSATVSDSAQADPSTSAAGLAFEYDKGRGRASFVQTEGRRVDVRVELLSVLVGAP